MRLGGFVPCSLSDFPGRIAAVVFTQGCNWRCPWCHNPSLVYPERYGEVLPTEPVLARLAKLRDRLDGVVVTGGEPTLHPGLTSFLARIKFLGLAVKLDTNGSRPTVLRELILARRVDFVAMDVKAPWTRYREAAGVDVAPATLQETIALLRDSGVPHLLRTTRWPGLTPDDERAITEIVRGSPHVWQDYRPPPPPPSPVRHSSN